jgi:para-nitrobenzyl esterase
LGAPPEPIESWQGTLDATNFGSAAIQSIRPVPLKVEESEDCLNLNIWSTTTEATERQPVLVWIHGGGFINWSSYMDEWNGEQLAKNKVVVVSINYRLGPLGFAYHPEAGSNFAVLDWVAALTWISKNIKQFGGDPDNVTIFGQSAGAVAVRTLLCTSSPYGLFHKAMMLSSGYEDYTHVRSPSFERLEENSSNFFKTQDFSALRKLPIQDIQKQLLVFAGVRPSRGQLHTPANLVWCPVQDDKIVGSLDACSKISLFYLDTPIMKPDFSLSLGAFMDSQNCKMFQPLYNATTLSEMAKLLGGTYADKVMQHFGDTPYYDALDALMTTAIWKEPALKSFHRFASLGMDSYLYCFSRVSPGNQASVELAYHCCDIPYLFGLVEKNDMYDDRDVELSKAFQYALTTFATSNIPRFADGKPWPKVDRSQPRITVLSNVLKDEELAKDSLIQILNPNI